VSRLFAVLFAGCMNSDNLYPRYFNDLQLFGDILSTLPGVDASSLTVLHSDGSPPFQFAGIPNPNVLAGTASALTSVLQGIAAAAAPTDRFILIASNHGGADGTVSYLWCWNEEKFSAPTFAQVCNPIAAQHQGYIFGQCNSGGFIPPLANGNRVVLAGSSQSGQTHQSSDQMYDEFLLRIAQSLQSGERRLASAFDAAKAADTAGDTPQFSDPGGIGTQTILLTGS
jgi:hypothetical protein